MAVIKLGALVTSIKGSLGGTCFKEQRGTQVMYRKSNGYSRAKLLQNNSLGYATTIFQRWAFLSDTLKSAWATQAAIYLFPDKFGNQVHLTARQLFTKCNINLQGLEYYDDVPAGFTNYIAEFSATVSEIDFSMNTAFTELGVESGIDTYVLVAIEVSKGSIQSPTFTRRKTIKRDLKSVDGNINYFDEIMENFPYVDNTYLFRVYITPMNVFGLRGTTIARTLQVVG